MITKSDLKIIKECLQAEGVRNSDFQEANKVPDKDNSYIAFIYEGKNYKIKVSNFEAIKSIIFNGNTFTPDENGNIVITQKDAITLVKFYGPEFPIYTTQPESNIKDGDYFYHTYSRQLMQWQNRGWHVVTLQPGLYFMQPDSSLWLYTEEQGLVRLLEDKQDLLISGTNIKTINGQSILGHGDLTITASQGSTIINYNGSQFLRIDDITDFSFPSSLVQGSVPEGGQILYDSVRHRFIYVVNGIMYTQWPQMEGVMASDAYATVDFVYKLGATVRIWKVTPNGLIDLVGTNEENLELVPFYAVKEEECPLVLEECSTEGVITYMQAYNVFALYKESNDTYYLLWTETQDRKGNGEYNLIDLSTTEAPYEKEENDPVYTIRQDRLFYLEVNAEDLMEVDISLSEESMNPVANKAITQALADQASSFNQSIGNINTILAALQDNSDLRLMLIDRLASSAIPWAFDINTYEGEEGRILIDPSRGKVILEVTTGNTVRYYNKWKGTDSRPSSEAFNLDKCVFAFIQDGVLHLGVVRNSQFIEIGVNANITIDNSLSQNSSNPVKNSAIYNKFDEVSQEYNALSSVVNNLGSTRLMPIAGLVTEPYDLKQQGYAGEDGEIFIDEANERIVLLVEKSIRSYWGYTVWNNAGGRYSNLDYDLHNQFFWYVDENSSLHIGRYLNHQFVEVIGNDQVVVDSTLNSQSSNPVKNSTLVHAFEEKQDVLIPGENIKTINGNSLIGSGNLEITGSSSVPKYATIIHYYGDDPQNKSGRWREGEVFFSTDDSALYECERDYDLPSKEIPLTEGFYYVLEPTPKFLYHNTEVGGTDETGEFIPLIEVDSVENINSKNPLENSVISKQLQGLRDLIDLYHPKEEIPPSDEPNDPGAPNVYSNTFDSTVGNWGELNVNTTIDGEVVSLKQNVEKITPELMGAAWDKLNVDYLDEGVTLIEDIADIANLSEGEKFMITGSAAGFLPGDGSVRASNLNLLKRIISTSDETFANCIGVKLDAVYELQGSGSSATSSRTLFIEKDFVIDGGNGSNEAVGGFHCAPSNLYTRWFSTNHSLNVRNTIFSYDCRDTTVGAIFSIRYNNFISQVQIVGCSFSSVSQRRAAGAAISFLSDVAIVLKPIEAQISNVQLELDKENKKEVKDTQKIAELEAQLKSLKDTLQAEAVKATPFVEGSNSSVKSNNAIDYVRILDNDFGNVYYQYGIQSNGGIRVNKGFLIQGNTFKEEGIIIDKGNGSNPSAVVGSEYGYLSCPMFVVNNTFTGYTEIYRPANSSSYCNAINANYQSLYVLNNTISNYISGKNAKGNYAGTYDFYANSSLVYSCNNHIHNLVRFTRESLDCGTIKAKGSGIPVRFRKDTGTGLYVPPVRYYAGNTYDIDKSECLAYWNARDEKYKIYDDEVLDAQGNLRERDIFGFHCGGYLSDDMVLTVFSNNIIKYPYIKSSAYLSSNVIEINNNTFSYEENGVSVPVKFAPIKGSNYDIFQMFYVAAKDRIDVIGNTFNFDNPIIDLLYISSPKYTSSISRYDGNKNVNVYNNVLYNHNILRYEYAGERKFEVFSNIQGQTEVGALVVPTTEAISLSDDTNVYQPVAVPDNVLINVNNSIYRRTAGSYVTNFFKFMSDEETGTFENLTFNNVTYTLKLTNTESVTVSINGKIDDIYQFRDIFSKALWDNGYMAINIDGKTYAKCAIYVISNHFGTNSWNRVSTGTPVTQDRSTGGKTDVKVFSVSPNLIMTSYHFEEYGYVRPFLDGENAVWTKVSEGDDPVPIGPTLPTVDTYDDLPLSAKVGDQVIVEGGTEAGTYECEEEGTPCSVNFAFRTKASDDTLGVACTFNNETFNIPFYENVSIALTLNGSLTPEQIRDAFVNAACTQLGLNASNEKEVYTKASPTYQIYYAQLGAKSNGESVWYNTGNSVIGSSSEFNSNKRQQLILHSDYPRANVQSANAPISRYSLSAGSRPTWKKID